MKRSCSAFFTRAAYVGTCVLSCLCSSPASNPISFKSCLAFQAQVKSALLPRALLNHVSNKESCSVLSLSKFRSISYPYIHLQNTY